MYVTGENGKLDLPLDFTLFLFLLHSLSLSVIFTWEDEGEMGFRT
jgi:hypothetical protein